MSDPGIKDDLVDTVMVDLLTDETLNAAEYQRLFDGLRRLRETDLMILTLAVSRLRTKMREPLPEDGEQAGTLFVDERGCTLFVDDRGLVLREHLCTFRKDKCSVCGVTLPPPRAPHARVAQAKQALRMDKAVEQAEKASGRADKAPADTSRRVRSRPKGK